MPLWMLFSLLLFLKVDCSNLNISSTFPSACSFCVAGIEAAELYQQGKPGEVTYFYQHRKDEAVPMQGLQNANEMMADDSSIAVMGAWNSAVTASLGNFISYIGIVIITVSTSPILADVQQFPTLIGITPTDNDWIVLLSDLIVDIGWTRVAIIHTNDPFSSEQMKSTLQISNEKAFEVVTTAQLSYNLRVRDADDVRFDVRQALQKIKDLYLFVICLFGIASDAQIILEEAYHMGMFGNSQYSWIGADGFADDLFENWELIKTQPDLGTGIITISYNCDASQLQYAQLQEFMALLGDDRQIPNIWECFVYDSYLALFSALAMTQEFMAARNIDVRCLQNDFFQDDMRLFNGESCDPNKSSIKNEIISLTSERGICNSQETSCKHCGVCALILQFESELRKGDHIHIYQLLLLSELYETDMQGSTGRLQLTETGKRRKSGLKFGILNSKREKLPPNGRRREENGNNNDDYGPPRFKKVGRLVATDQDYTITYEEPLVFAGSSSENVINEPNADVPASTTIAIPDIARYIFVALSGLFLILSLITVGLFVKSRERKVIVASTPILMYFLMSGIFLTYLSLFLFFLGELSHNSCLVYTWLSAIGWLFIFVPIILKTYRIKAIFRDQSGNTAYYLPNRHLIAVLLSCLFVLVLFLTLQSIFIDNAVDYKVTVRIEGNTIEASCVTNWWNYVLFFIEFLVVSTSLILAVHIYTIPHKIYNESRAICFSVYNWFIFNTVIKVVFLVIKDSVSSTLKSVVLFTSVFVCNTAFLLSFFWYKILYLHNFSDTSTTNVTCGELPNRTTISHGGLHCASLPNSNADFFGPSRKNSMTPTNSVRSATRDGDAVSNPASSPVLAKWTAAKFDVPRTVETIEVQGDDPENCYSIKLE